jgi:hypothetical protein
MSENGVSVKWFVVKEHQWSQKMPDVWWTSGSIWMCNAGIFFHLVSKKCHLWGDFTGIKMLGNLDIIVWQGRNPGESQLWFSILKCCWFTYPTTELCCFTQSLILCYAIVHIIYLCQVEPILNYVWPEYRISEQHKCVMYP